MLYSLSLMLDAGFTSVHSRPWLGSGVAHQGWAWRHLLGENPHHLHNGANPPSQQLVWGQSHIKKLIEFGREKKRETSRENIKRNKKKIALSLLRRGPRPPHCRYLCVSSSHFQPSRTRYPGSSFTSSFCFGILSVPRTRGARGNAPGTRVDSSFRTRHVSKGIRVPKMPRLATLDKREDRKNKNSILSLRTQACGGSGTARILRGGGREAGSWDSWSRPP